MTQEIQQHIARINASIDSNPFQAKPDNLYEPINYIMNLGGKRMRPLLCILAYQLYKDEVDEIVPAAVSIETFHNFTLMHDDIMDKAPLRRGKETVHEKWNDAVGILSGDVMLVKAYEQLIANVPESKLKEVLSKFNQCATEVCEGQQRDMDFEERTEVSEMEYLDMIRQKTAVLLGYSLELGGILATENEAEHALLYEMGVNAGVGFQLMDDLLDVYADQSKFGKQLGGDIIANKKTFLLIKAKELASGDSLLALNTWLQKNDFDAKEKVKAVTKIYNHLQIKELTENKMNQYFEKAFQNLKDLNATDDRKDSIKQFFDYLMQRQK